MLERKLVSPEIFTDYQFLKKVALISGFINASEINKKVSYFSFCVKITNQEGDFYGVLQFLDPGFIEK